MKKLRTPLLAVSALAGTTLAYGPMMIEGIKNQNQEFYAALYPDNSPNLNGDCSDGVSSNQDYDLAFCLEGTTYDDATSGGTPLNRIRVVAWTKEESIAGDDGEIAIAITAYSLSGAWTAENFLIDIYKDETGCSITDDATTCLGNTDRWNVNDDYVINNTSVPFHITHTYTMLDSGEYSLSYFMGSTVPGSMELYNLPMMTVGAEIQGSSISITSIDPSTDNFVEVSYTYTPSISGGTEGIDIPYVRVTETDTGNVVEELALVNTPLSSPNGTFEIPANYGTNYTIDLLIDSQYGDDAIASDTTSSNDIVEPLVEATLSETDSTIEMEFTLSNWNNTSADLVSLTAIPRNIYGEVIEGGEQTIAIDSSTRTNIISLTNAIGNVDEEIFGIDFRYTWEADLNPNADGNEYISLEMSVIDSENGPSELFDMINRDEDDYKERPGDGDNGDNGEDITDDSNMGLIIGASVGGAAGLAVVGGGTYWYLNKGKGGSSSKPSSSKSPKPKTEPKKELNPKVESKTKSKTTTKTTKK